MASYCEICRTDFDTEATCGCVVARLELRELEARALAVFLKRLMLDDFAAKCGAHELSRKAEKPGLHYAMRDGAAKVAMALAEKGFDPR